MDLQNVVITGVGPVSAIGSGREAFWSALRSGQPGFGPITLCDTEGLESTIAAEVKGFDLTVLSEDEPGPAPGARQPRFSDYRHASRSPPSPPAPGSPQPRPGRS